MHDAATAGPAAGGFNRVVSDLSRTENIPRNDTGTNENLTTIFYLHYFLTITKRALQLLSIL